jgi:hypothetical protein
MGLGHPSRPRQVVWHNSAIKSQMYLQKNCKCVYCLKAVITHLSAASDGLIFAKLLKPILSAENQLEDSCAQCCKTFLPA